MSTNSNTFGYWKKLYEEADTVAQRLLIKKQFVEKFGSKALEEAHFDDSDMNLLRKKMNQYRADKGYHGYKPAVKMSVRREPNPMCDQQDCVTSVGEVRVLPHTKDPSGGNDILCHHCYGKAMQYRKERNQELGQDAQYDLPKWEDLRAYGEE